MRFFLHSIAAFCCCAAIAHAADWNQWRGPNRDGLAPNSPALLDALPADGLRAEWLNTADVPEGSGWASPVVSDGRVYLYCHTRSKREGVSLPPEKYPSLEKERREKMSREEIDEYEANRQREHLQRLRQEFRYDDVICCLDAESGRLVWKYQQEGAHTRWRQSSTPAVVQGKLFFVSSDPGLRCLNAQDGRELWRTPLPEGQDAGDDEPVASSLAVTSGVVVALARGLVAADMETGAIRWKSDPKQSAGLYSSPVVWNSPAGEKIIANVKGRETVCVDPRTGREIWRVESQANRSTPVVTRDKLLTYGGSRKSGLRCFRMTLEGAEELWAFQGVADDGSSPVVVGDQVYVQGDKRVACVDLQTGRAQWRATLDLENPRYTSLVAADNKVYYALDGVLCFAATPEKFDPKFAAKIDNEGRLATTDSLRRTLGIAELEQTQGQEQAQRAWRSAIGRNRPLKCCSPAIANGRLFVRLNSGVVCYDLRAR